MNDENPPPDDGARHAPTTTHAGWGAGHPRLLVSGHSDRFTHDLTEDVTRIGFASDNELALPDTDPLHATIRHDDNDEYVLTLHGVGDMNATGATTAGGDLTETLRTGASFTAGPWRLVFQRDESADHGRPFGGRQGGELSDQPLQPPRPEYAATADMPPPTED